MPRSSHVPAYCIHKPGGRACVGIRGQLIYRGVYGSDESKAEYGRLVAELAASPGATTAPTVSKMTVVERIDVYLAVHAADRGGHGAS